MRSLINGVSLCNEDNKKIDNKKVKKYLTIDTLNKDSDVLESF